MKTEMICCWIWCTKSYSEIFEENTWSKYEEEIVNLFSILVYNINLFADLKQCGVFYIKLI